MNLDGLRRYVRVVADHFGLVDWTIEVSDKPCDEGTLADTGVTYGQRHAVIRFHEKWQEWSKDDLRSTVVHELLHVHTEPIDDIAGDVFAATLEEQAATVAVAAVSYQLERSVDQIAVAVAPFFPYPADVAKQLTWGNVR